MNISYNHLTNFHSLKFKLLHIRVDFGFFMLLFMCQQVPLEIQQIVEYLLANITFVSVFVHSGHVNPERPWVGQLLSTNGTLVLRVVLVFVVLLVSLQERPLNEARYGH